MKRNRKQRDRYNSGFTLIEVLAVALIVGILSAIVAPSFLSVANNQRINSAQTQAFSSLRLAQSTAKKNKVTWQASFRNTATAAQYAVHPTLLNEDKKSVDEVTTFYKSLGWQDFADGTQIDNSFTKFKKITTTDADVRVYRVQFKSDGTVNGQLGRITFSTNNSKKLKCVYVSTLLGALRADEDDGCKASQT